MMNINKYAKETGFTLVELLLVLVIATAMIMLGTGYLQQRAESLRIDRTAIQVQYILNAALAYYVANGTWPGANGTWYTLNGSNSSPLQPNYLPGTPILNPWGINASTYRHGYNIAWDAPPNTFEVALYMGTSPQQQAAANILAGKVPFGFYDPTGWLISYVSIPAQNLNNATAINFAGLYHHGGCVPVPTCPNVAGITMIPQVFVVPVSVSGVNDIGTTKVYPISSFTAYATGNNPSDNNPPLCTNQSVITGGSCANGGTNNQFWRVCLQVVTERGDVALTRNDQWGQYVTVGAFTRCAISGEPSGSGFNVYGN